MIFNDSRPTIGVVLPIQERQRHDIDFGLQLELAHRADELGFSAIWIRDVPLNSAAYPDPVGHSDPWVLLGALAFGSLWFANRLFQREAILTRWR